MAQFHVWSWPFIFGAIHNMPTFLAGLLLSLPLEALWPELPESVSYLSVLLFVPVLWFWSVELCMVSSPKWVRSVCAADCAAAYHRALAVAQAQGNLRGRATPFSADTG